MTETFAPDGHLVQLPDGEHSENCMCWTRLVPLGIIRDHNNGQHDRCPNDCPARQRST